MRYVKMLNGGKRVDYVNVLCYSVCMIFEFIENGLPAGYKTNKSIYSNVSALQPIFDRMALPLPSKYRHLQYTREGGFNLFLNRYGMVLRFYPYNDEAQARREDGLNFHDHIYHAKILPYIGCVRYANFTMQLMPAVNICRDHDYSYHLATKLMCDLGSSIDGTVVSNAGYKVGAPEGADSRILLDTIYMTDEIEQRYLQYLSKKQRDILKNFEGYADLQHMFHDAWRGSTAQNHSTMAGFWGEAKRICDMGECLHPSWLDIDPNQNVEFSHTISAKGNFVRASKSYDRKLGQSLGEPSFLSSVCSKALHALGM